MAQINGPVAATPSVRPVRLRDMPHPLLLFPFRQGENKKGVSASRIAQPRGTVTGKPSRPASPAYADGNVLFAVEAVRDRTGMVSRAALESPENLASLGLISREETFGVAREDEPPACASTPATIGERVATSHLILPVVTSIALKEPEAWLSRRVSELPQ